MAWTDITDAQINEAMPSVGSALPDTEMPNRVLLNRLYRDLQGNAQYLEDNKVTLVNVPTSPVGAGTLGQIAIDSGYLYVCIATDTWVRTPLTTW